MTLEGKAANNSSPPRFTTQHPAALLGRFQEQKGHGEVRSTGWGGPTQDGWAHPRLERSHALPCSAPTNTNYQISLFHHFALLNAKIFILCYDCLFQIKFSLNMTTILEDEKYFGGFLKQTFK